MRNLFAALILTLLCASQSPAIEVAGVKLDQTVTVHSQQLNLHGHGSEKSFSLRSTSARFIAPNVSPALEMRCATTAIN